MTRVNDVCDARRDDARPGGFTPQPLEPAGVPHADGSPMVVASVMDERRRHQLEHADAQRRSAGYRAGAGGEQPADVPFRPAVRGDGGTSLTGRNTSLFSQLWVFIAAAAAGLTLLSFTGTRHPYRSAGGDVSAERGRGDELAAVRGRGARSSVRESRSWRRRGAELARGEHQPGDWPCAGRFLLSLAGPWMVFA